MKFIVSSFEILKQLQILNILIKKNNSLPILENFLFELKKKNLKITSSNLNNTLIIYINVISEDYGKVVVPAKLIINFLKTFDDQLITISFNEIKNILFFYTKNGCYSLSVQNEKEFPEITIINNNNYLTIKSSILLKIINKTIFASSSDDLNPVMTGILFNLNTKESNFVSTDTHKLVKYSIYNLKLNNIAEFIVPNKSLHILKNILDSENVTIEYNDNNIKFFFKKKILICQLINGKYPNYEEVIPKNNNKIIKINRISFLNSLKRILLFSNKNTYQVNLEFKIKKIYLSSKDMDFSNEAKEYLYCDYNDKDIKISFNSKFLIEILLNIDSENIIFEILNSNYPVIIKPELNKEINEKVVMLIMPILS